MKNDKFMFFRSMFVSSLSMTDEEFGRAMRRLCLFAFQEEDEDDSEQVRGLISTLASRLEGVLESPLEMAFTITSKPLVKQSIKLSQAGLKGGLQKKPKPPSKPPSQISPSPLCNGEESRGEEGKGEEGGLASQAQPAPYQDYTQNSDLENVSQKFEVIRKFANENGFQPKCHDLFIPHIQKDAVFKCFTLYTSEQITNAITNYVFHLTRPDGFTEPNVYSSLFTFLEKGVPRYHDDDAFEPQFKQKGDRK